MWYNKELPASALVNRCFDKVFQRGERIIFNANGNKSIVLEHVQDCCENVYIESIVGDLSDLENTPILRCEIAYQKSRDNESSSNTWTFIKLATIKGYVDIRFYGDSNGYYSETAEFYEER